MTQKTKNSLYILVIGVAATAAATMLLGNIDQYYRQSDDLVGTDVGKDYAAGQGELKTFQNGDIEFKYPQNIIVTEKDGQVTLNHNIPFQNHGTCDMRGDEQTYPTLDDFNVYIRIMDGNLAQAAKSSSSYMPAENFASDTLKISPGYIDKYQVGDWSGFAIYEGVEGCGHTRYYFPVNSAKTLVVTKDMVQQLSGVMSSNIKEEILKVPGAISPEESDKIFRQILESLKVNQSFNN